MISEDELAEQWTAQRAVEIEEAKGKDTGKAGRPSTTQQFIIAAVDREVTRGDVQTRLATRNGIFLDSNNLATQLNRLWEAGKIRRVEKVFGMIIWGPLE